jgi:alpha 1,2-mannosyltransferase
MSYRNLDKKQVTLLASSFLLAILLLTIYQYESLVSASTTHPIYQRTCNGTWAVSKAFADWMSRNDRPSSNQSSALCDEQCVQFRQLITSSWPANKTRAVIHVLVQSKRLHRLKVMLSSLDTHFNDKYKYPLIIFYEEVDRNFSESVVRNLTRSLVFFQKIRFEIPPYVNLSQVKIPSGGHRTRVVSHPGYHHMCRFQAFTLYDHPIMDPQVKYAWRLDDDSHILAPVKYDVFELMRDKQIQYGYNTICTDSSDLVVGLWEAVDLYISVTNLDPRRFKQWGRARYYYNNFEISEVSIWRSENYRKLCNYLDQLGGIYYHRWGDGPIKSIGVSLFVPTEKLHRFGDVRYNHNGIWI